MVNLIKGGKSLQERLAEQNAEASEVTSTEAEKEIKKNLSKKSKDSKDSNISKIVSNKLDAMEVYNLTPETTGVNAPLEDEDHFYFSMIVKKLKTTSKELAAKYVIECTKRDLLKYNLPYNKEYLEK